MQTFELEEDQKTGKIFRKWKLNQGDTFFTQLVIKMNGEQVDPELISDLKFKLGNYETNDAEFVQDFEYNEQLNKWLLKIASVDTMEWAETKHWYEYQLTYVDGTVKTPVRWKFEVLKQIKGE